MKKFGICLTFVLIAFAAVYYFRGASESYLSKSYFLEKRLRHLLFLETHEPVDYVSVAEEYESLLKNIRLSAKTNQKEIYEEALARTKISIQIISRLRQYKADQNTLELENAHRLYVKVLTEKLNEYYFYSLYLDNQLITEEWFRDELLKVNQQPPT